MRTKLFALLSVLMLVSLVLTACGAPATPAATRAAEVPEPVTVVQTQIVEVTPMPARQPRSRDRGRRRWR